MHLFMSSLVEGSIYLWSYLTFGPPALCLELGSKAIMFVGVPYTQCVVLYSFLSLVVWLSYGWGQFLLSINILLFLLGMFHQVLLSFCEYLEGLTLAPKLLQGNITYIWLDLKMSPHFCLLFQHSCVLWMFNSHKPQPSPLIISFSSTLALVQR